MKLRLFISLLFISYHVTIMAQQFAPAGAVWYHDMRWGVFKSYVAGDTSISGISCRKVIQEPIRGAFGPTVIIKPEHLFIYNNADTVFLFNTLFSRFTPLYVFNVNDGDTVSLPVIPDDDGCTIPTSLHFTYDTTFRFVIDSVRMKSFDGTMLKTVYSHPITGDTSFIAWGKWGNQNIYAEQIGSITSGLTPSCYNCSGTLMDNCGQLDSLRCYTDASIAVKLTAGTCNDGLFPAQLPLSDLMQGLRISPNPASGILQLSDEPLTRSLELQLYNTSGQAVLHNTMLQGTIPNIDIRLLLPGIYFITATGQKELQLKGTFIKQ